MFFSWFVCVKVLRQGAPTIIATHRLHSLKDSRTRLREIDSAVPG
ncbi:hypothetical protein C4K09_2549 [Pseudomonas chlororaphis subsp. aureofaciens]|nr:hypothetical protein C4K09_2549 [Pseudomonas chlororaphis subsp. aureofaciens]